MTLTRTAALALAAAVLLPACGHKGPPVAPRRRTPPALGDFRLAQRGEVLELSLTAPRASLDGVAYESVDIELVWGQGRLDLEKAGHKRVVRATPGTRVVETLPLPAPESLVRAAARAVVGGHRGQRTLILALEAQAPLAAPHDLTAELREKGVTLSWQGERPEPVAPPDLGAPGASRRPFSGAAPAEEEAPDPQGSGNETAAPGEDDPGAPKPLQGSVSETSEEEPLVEPPTTPHGFRVYRRVPPGGYGLALNFEPQEERIFTDQAAPLGATACYVARAIGSVDPLIESASSNEACVEVRDIVPPSPPTGLAVVPRGAGLEVVWSPAAEGDLGGYRIYRASEDQEPAQVGEVEAGTTTWLDASAESVVLYRYTITSVDRAGNEGPPSGAAEGRRP